ncbi:competence protein ComF [Actibacterium mucosum KCTC 23349]|uniref:Competence protein ComF n=1 Tax=Actibacterium mucosum KCTC 23349 TaxID=1454373 RepID=A0A037ZLF0_9RHOB|nr:competence protein ComF [Actibacterium mucosum KCTC 23349]
MQSAVRMIFPPECVSCRAPVDTEFALCGDCWRDTPFIVGAVCDQCGTPVPQGDEADEDLRCDDCLRKPPPWSRGRAAVLYSDNARSMVLGLKHGDRQDLARPMSEWMARAARPILQKDMLVTSVPLNRWRLLKRRYNQSALLAQRIAQDAGLDYCPDLMLRPRATPKLDGKDAAAREETVSGALKLHPRHRDRAHGRHVLIVDDVMTSGATLSEATHILRAAGARNVSVLVFARVAKEP